MATPVFDASSTKAAGTANPTLSDTIVIGSGSNRYAKVAVSVNSGFASASSGVTIGGNACTLAPGGRLRGAANFTLVEYWYLLNPPSGSQSIVVTSSNPPETVGIVGTSYSGVNQTTPHNLGATTLSAAISTTGATSMTVTSASGFPSSGNYDVQIDTEVVTVTAGQGTTTWTITRGARGTTAATHSNGASVLQAIGAATGTTTTPTVTAQSATGELVVDAVAVSDFAITACSQTSRGTVSDAGTNTSCGASEASAGSGTTSMSWTVASGGSGWCSLAASLIGVTGSGGGSATLAWSKA